MDSREAGYWLRSSPYKRTQRLLNTVTVHLHGWMEGWINNEHREAEGDRLILTAFCSCELFCLFIDSFLIVLFYSVTVFMYKC